LIDHHIIYFAVAVVELEMESCLKKQGFSVISLKSRLSQATDTDGGNQAVLAKVRHP
jgi:hypothetical protein